MPGGGFCGGFDKGTGPRLYSVTPVSFGDKCVWQMAEETKSHCSKTLVASQNLLKHSLDKSSWWLWVGEDPGRASTLTLSHLQGALCLRPTMWALSTLSFHQAFNGKLRRKDSLIVKLLNGSARG